MLTEIKSIKEQKKIRLNLCFNIASGSAMLVLRISGAHEKKHFTKPTKFKL